MLPGDAYTVRAVLPISARSVKCPSVARSSHAIGPAAATIACGGSASATRRRAAPPDFGVSTSAPRDQ